VKNTKSAKKSTNKKSSTTTKKPVTAVVVLRRALKLIESGWTRGSDARNHGGDPVSPKHSSAQRFCAQGALTRAMHDLKVASKTVNRACGLLDDVAKENRFNMIEDLNDAAKSKKPVIAAFNTAIKRAEIKKK